MMDDEETDRLYSTGEIVLAMVIVFVTLTIPTLAGLVYYVWFF